MPAWHLRHGQPPPGEAERYGDEGPQHELRFIRGFWIGEAPVTQGQYEALMKANPSQFTGDARRPVENVTWHEAVAFCAALSRLLGAKARLPRAAEWEYACRAGTTTRFGSGDAEADLAKVGWYTSNAGGTTHPVGQKPANRWGLHDVHGNVWEWGADATATYTSAPVTADPLADPADPGAAGRAMRGGSWGDGPRGCRSACRVGGLPADWSRGRGFRVLVPAAPSPTAWEKRSRERHGETAAESIGW